MDDRELRSLGVLTRQQVVDEAPQSWARQYAGTTSLRHAEITGKLLSLPKPVSGEEVDRLIGNRSWTRLTCDVCPAAPRDDPQPDVDAVVTFSARWGDDTVNVCPTCLRAALSQVSDSERPSNVITNEVQS